MTFAAVGAASPKAMGRLGYGCISFDVGRGEQDAITHKRVVDLFQGWARRTLIIGASFSSPSCTWVLSGAACWRDSRHMLSLPRSSSIDRIHIEEG